MAATTNGTHRTNGKASTRNGLASKKKAPAHDTHDDGGLTPDEIRQHAEMIRKALAGPDGRKLIGKIHMARQGEDPGQDAFLPHGWHSWPFCFMPVGIFGELVWSNNYSAEFACTGGVTLPETSDMQYWRSIRDRVEFHKELCRFDTKRGVRSTRCIPLEGEDLQAIRLDERFINNDKTPGRPEEWIVGKPSFVDGIIPLILDEQWHQSRPFTTEKAREAIHGAFPIFPLSEVIDGVDTMRLTDNGQQTFADATE